MDYDAIPAVRWSHLAAMRESPAHYQAAVSGEYDSAGTRSTTWGTWLHSAVLDPSWAPAVWDGAKTDRGFRAFKADRFGLDILTQREYLAVRRAAAAVATHPTAGILFDGGGEREQPVTWVESIPSIHGAALPCKARPDYRDMETLIDLKSCQSAELRRFASSAARYGYPGQLAHYASGLETIGCRIRRHYLVAVESTPPYDVVVYEIDRVTMGLARQERDRLLARVAECTIRHGAAGATNAWPGRADLPQPLALPEWALRDDGVTAGESWGDEDDE